MSINVSIKSSFFLLFCVLHFASCTVPNHHSYTNEHERGHREKMSNGALSGLAEQDHSAQFVSTGGWSSYREPQAEELALFDTVYHVEPDLSPYAVATQVVAGTNYRFLCRDEVMDEYMVTIFLPLPCYRDAQPPAVTKIERLTQLTNN